MSFLTDPALRRIAAVTNDVLAEHLWRYDTATEDALGDLARILHRTALGFNNTTAFLDKAVQELTARPDLRLADYGQALPNVLAAVQRHGILADLLIDAYRAWRRHRQIEQHRDERHLLLQPGDPSRGVAVLRAHGPHTWRVLPDAEAAEAFGVPSRCRIIGQVAWTDDGWLPTAYTNPEHLQAQPAITYRLPVCDDLAPACRSLLRWWQLRHSATWRSRTPDQLTESELDQLAA
ncbi:hypothetical protein [Micromonospora sp. ATA51]|uniref:hypothetical protein n=1 Tax=Micromonospora sp. ATA51 TaxID=2806098 RepID=UPI001A446978|nr:hypothetical protein [Micromonospora sp. ATA51]MBM0224524.1 hypothetical protein [Micromonospora sp. ATA51]